MNEDEDALEDLGEEDGLWFDFTFVEFLKTNYSKSPAAHASTESDSLFLQSRYSAPSFSTPAQTTLVVCDCPTFFSSPR